MKGKTINLKGTHFEIGQQVGNQYKIWGKREVYIPKYADDFYKTQLNMYSSYYPLYLEYLSGIANTLGIPKDLVFKSYLTGFLEIANKKPKKCSVFATVRHNKTFVGRNYDWLSASESASRIFTYSFSDSNLYSFVGISDMGLWITKSKTHTSEFVILIEDAWNSQGLFICLNGAPEVNCQPGFATPHVVQMIAETCKTTEEGINILEKIEIEQPKIFTLADKKGNLAVVEKRLKGTYVTRSNQQVIATNHYQNSKIIHLNLPIFEKVPFHSTFSRKEYLSTNLLTTKNLDLKVVKALMSKPPVIQDWRKIDTVTCWSTSLDLSSGEYDTTIGPISKKPIRYTKKV